MNRLFIHARTNLPVLVALLLGACAANPVTGHRELVLMSEDQEIALGRQNDPNIRTEYGAYDDPALQAYVQKIGEKLAAHSHRPNLIYRFTILDSDEVNAFALPGGYIYITRGILAYLNSEAELAAVLGHEIGHVTARHSVRQYTAAATANIAIGLIGGGQAGQQLLGALGGALLSGYGRDHELEADRLGAEYLARDNYDPDAILGVMTVLKNQEEAEKKRAQAEGREAQVYHGVFASHPSADQRLQEVVGEARRFKTSATTRVARDEYMQHVDRLVFGDSAREGVRRGSSFYHRDFNLALSFPSGWRLRNTTKAVIASSPARDAMMQMTIEDLNKNLSPQEYLRSRVKANALSDERSLQGVTIPSATAIARMSGPFGVRNTRVVVLFHQNRAVTLFGTVKDDAAFRRLDDAYLAAARSFHPLRDDERRIAEGLRLRSIKARKGDTFAALAKRSPISDYAELTLRLINNKLSGGEPEPGRWIKVVE